MARPASTLIFIHADTLARADFTAGPRPELIKVWRQARPRDLALADTVQTAIQLGPRCGKRAWVLCEDLWTQLLTFPAATVNGLGAAQLVRAFAFESEPLSGIPGTDASIGFAAVERADDNRSFWITAIQSGERNRINAVVRRAGGNLAGILHPGGANSPIAPGSASHAWSRVEMWRQSTICVSGNGHTRDKIQIINASNVQPRVKASVSSWMLTSVSAAKHSEILEAEGKPEKPVESETNPRFTLRMDEQFSLWAKAWASALAASPQVPVIIPAPEPTPKHWFVTAGVLAEAAVLALCFAHYHFTDRDFKALAAENAQFKSGVQALGEAEKKTTEIKKELEKLTEENDKARAELTRAKDEFTRMKLRVPAILKSLSEHRPEDTMIESIETAGPWVTVSGLSLQSSEPEQLAASLATPLRAAGLEVMSPDKQASNMLKNGGPWSFSLDLKEISTFASASANGEEQKRPTHKRAR